MRLFRILVTSIVIYFVVFVNSAFVESLSWEIVSQIFQTVKTANAELDAVIRHHIWVMFIPALYYLLPRDSLGINKHNMAPSVCEDDIEFLRSVRNFEISAFNWRGDLTPDEYLEKADKASKTINEC